MSDITRKARVGRATYYAHYSSKHELLRSQFDRIIAPMLRPKRDDPCRVDCTKLFEHVKTQVRLYEALMKGSAERGGARILKECLEGRTRQLLEPPSGLSPFDLSTSMITGFVASSLLAILEGWVFGGARETPDEMQRIFRRLVGYGLAGSALKA